MALRYRLWLALAPLLVVLAAAGGGIVYAFDVVGGRIDAILRENHRSVEAMHGLNEAAERIDSSFEAALAGRPGARTQFDANWTEFRRHLEFERGNVTEPGEAELVADLDEAATTYETQGKRFFDPGRASVRVADYAAPDGTPGPLAASFARIKKLSGDIRALNQRGMEAASAKAREAAATARLWAAGGLLLALVAAGFLGWRAARAVVRPVEALIRSVAAVGEGRFEQRVEATAGGEVGALAAAFNRMTAQLRDLRATQAAKLLRAQQASQAALDAFPDPVLLVDPAGRVEMSNPAARQILGVEPSERVWEPPDALRGPLAAALADRRPTVSRSFDQAVPYRVNGEDRTFVPQVLPVGDPYGNALGAAVVLNDVTRFRLLDEFKTDLVATASHELKTPLAGLRLAVHLLIEEAVGPLAPKQIELLVDARDNTERLVRTVDHLLALARLERGETLAFRPEHPLALLKAAVDRTQPVLSDRRIVFDADPAVPPVAADADRLGHALDNLLVNAATYTAADGTITLSARAAADGRIELAVADTGVGIPAEFVPHVFDKFFRIPGRSKGQGTGLGLAIVREIALAHGGTITCESREGEGTTFRITLPGAELRMKNAEFGTRTEE